MTTQPSHFRKTLPAFLAALGMTGVIGVCMLAFGVGALLNRKTTPIQAAANQAPVVYEQQTTVQQLQDLVAQYQAREAQYQTQLQQATDQISLLSQQNQQYQAYQDIVTALENAGVLQIASDGSVIVNLGSSANAGTRVETESGEE
jgi:small-conductance mechanosensitive channel